MKTSKKELCRALAWSKLRTWSVQERFLWVPTAPAPEPNAVTSVAIAAAVLNEQSRSGVESFERKNKKIAPRTLRDSGLVQSV